MHTRYKVYTMGNGISVVGNGLTEESAVSSLIANLLELDYKIPKNYTTIESFLDGDRWKIEIEGYGVYRVVVINNTGIDSRIYTASMEYIG